MRHCYIHDAVQQIKQGVRLKNVQKEVCAKINQIAEISGEINAPRSLAGEIRRRIAAGQGLFTAAVFRM
jgi:hypothetical protein